MATFPQRPRISQPCFAAVILSAIADNALTWMRYVIMRKLPPQWARAFRRPVCRKRQSVMNGSKYRFNDHREFFRPASKVEPNGHRNGAGSSAPRSQRCVEGNGQPPGEHHRHCTAGEIASELGYSVSYVLAVKKAMYPNEATRPRRLDPVEVSEWIYAHPSFRMRDVYECHPKDDPRQERLAFEGV